MTRISPNSSISSMSPRAEAAEILADMQNAARSLGMELLDSLSQSSNSSISTDSLSSLSVSSAMSTYTEATASKVFNENLKTLTQNLKEYVLSGESEVEMHQRDQVADFIVSAFFNESEKLILNFDSITEIPESINLLSNLEEIDLSGCSLLTKLPDVLDCFPVLLKLNLQGCRSLTSLPRSVMGARWFTSIFMQDTGIDLANPTKASVQSFKTT